MRGGAEFRYLAQTHVDFQRWILQVFSFQFEVEPCDRSKNAVMSFELSNAPSTFEWLMKHILSFNDSEEICRLRKVFDRLREANLKLNADKCALFQMEV